MLKRRPEILYRGAVERNITFTEQKAIALKTFAVAVSEGGIRCMAAKVTGLTPSLASPPYGG
jgi:hypothetical protein